jgi:hypothetical protein
MHVLESLANSVFDRDNRNVSEGWQAVCPVSGRADRKPDIRPWRDWPGTDRQVSVWRAGKAGDTIGQMSRQREETPLSGTS